MHFPSDDPPLLTNQNLNSFWNGAQLKIQFQFFWKKKNRRNPGWKTVAPQPVPLLFCAHPRSGIRHGIVGVGRSWRFWKDKKRFWTVGLPWPRARWGSGVSVWTVPLRCANRESRRNRRTTAPRTSSAACGRRASTRDRPAARLCGQPNRWRTPVGRTRTAVTVTTLRSAARPVASPLWSCRKRPPSGTLCRRSWKTSSPPPCLSSSCGTSPTTPRWRTWPTARNRPRWPPKTLWTRRFPDRKQKTYSRNGRLVGQI